MMEHVLPVDSLAYRETLLLSPVVRFILGSIYRVQISRQKLKPELNVRITTLVDVHLNDFPSPI